jgi:hypothetical protein
MILIRNDLECVITLDDPNIILSKNRDTMILNILKEKFEGKCYSSCYILNVIKIIRRSLIYCNENLDANFNVNISFEAKVIVYQVNEIINNCEIIKKEQSGIIHGKTEYGGVQLNIQQNMAIFNTGEKTPIIVKNLRYNINQTEISILAIPFIPIEYDVIFYKTTNDLASDDYDKLKKLTEQIGELDNQIKKLDNQKLKIFNFFKDIIINYKLKDGKLFDKFIKDLTTDNKLQKIIKDHTTTVINGLLNELKTTKSNDYILFKNYNSYDSNYCNKIDLSNLDEDDILLFNSEMNLNMVIISESMYKILELYLHENMRNKQTLLNFVDSYPTFKDVEKSKNIWKLHLLLKK